MHPLAVKNLAISLYQNHYHSIRKTANAVQIPKSSIHRWVQSSKLIARQRKARDDHEVLRQLMLNELNRSPFHTLTSLRSAILGNQEGPTGKVSTKRVSSVLRSLQWSRKKVFAQSIVSPLQKQKEFAFLQQVAGLSDWISVDETSIALDMAPLYGYSPRGKRLREPRTNRPRFQRFSMVMAIHKDAVISYRWIKGSYNSDSFASFLADLPDRFKGYPVLMDNVAFHKTQKVLDTLRSKMMRPLYIPPYSPQFNPIENAFSVFKCHFRKLFQVDSIHRRIEEALQHIQPSTLNGFYRNANRHIWTLQLQV